MEYAVRRIGIIASVLIVATYFVASGEGGTGRAVATISGAFAEKEVYAFMILVTLLIAMVLVYVYEEMKA